MVGPLAIIMLSGFDPDDNSLQPCIAFPQILELTQILPETALLEKETPMVLGYELLTIVAPVGKVQLEVGKVEKLAL